MKVVERMHVGSPRFSHTSEVLALAFTPDGTGLIAADFSGGTSRWTLDGKQVWHSELGGQEVRFAGENLLVSGNGRAAWLDPKTGAVTAAVLPDVDGISHAVPIADGGVAVWSIMESGGRIIFGAAVLGADGALRKAEGELGELKRRGAPGTVVASPDGRAIAVTDWTRVRVLAAADLAPRWSRDLADVLELDWAGDVVAAGLRSGEVVFLAAKDGSEISRVKPEGGACAIRFDGDRLAIGLTRGGVRVMDRMATKELARFIPDGLGEERVTALGFGPRGRLAMGLERRATIVEQETRKEFGGIAAHPGGVVGLAIFPAHVVSRGSGDLESVKTIAWTATGEVVTRDSHAATYSSAPMAAGPGGVLLDAADDGTLHIRNPRDLQIAGSIPTGAARRPIALAVAAKASRAAVALERDVIVVVDLAASKVLKEIPCAGLDGGTFLMSPNGGRIVASAHRQSRGVDGGERSGLGDVDLGSGNRGDRNPDLDRRDDSRAAPAPISLLIDVETGTSRELEASALAFLDDDSLIARGNGLAVVPISGGEVREVLGDSGPGILEGAVSPDGKWVAVVDWDDDAALRLFKTGVWKPHVVAKGLGVALLAFSASSKVLGAGMRDGSVRTWDIGEK